MISYSPNSVLWIHHEFGGGGGVRCIYLYIVVSPYVRGASYIFAPVPVLYIVAFGPQIIQVAYS
jgi:hypothetical protein